MFSSKSLIVSALTLRSLIHFEFIFEHGVRECSNFILLHVPVQFSQHHLLKRLSFLHCLFIFSISSWFSPGRLHLSKNLSIAHVVHFIGTELLVVVSYDALYFFGVHCNFSFFISNFIDLSLLFLFLDESG